MKVSKSVSSLLCIVVCPLFLAAAQPAPTIDPRGNLSGVWVDEFRNEFIVTQRGNRRVAVKYLNDAGNLIWHSASGQALKKGNKWVMHMNLRLKSGGTKPRKGEVVVGRGRIDWAGGHSWTLVATPQMQIAELQQALLDAQTHATKLTAKVLELQRLLQQKNALNTRLRDAVADGRADTQKLKDEVRELDDRYKSDVGALLKDYLALEQEYACVLRQKNISDKQRQQIAEQLERIKDLAKPLVGLDSSQAFAPKSPRNSLNW